MPQVRLQVHVPSGSGFASLDTCVVNTIAVPPLTVLDGPPDVDVTQLPSKTVAADVMSAPSMTLIVTVGKKALAANFMMMSCAATADVAVA